MTTSQCTAINAEYIEPGHRFAGPLKTTSVPPSLISTHSPGSCTLIGSRSRTLGCATGMGVASPTPVPSSSPLVILLSGSLVDIPGEGCPPSSRCRDSSTLPLSGTATPTCSLPLTAIVSIGMNTLLALTPSPSTPRKISGGSTGDAMKSVCRLMSRRFAIIRKTIGIMNTGNANSSNLG